MKKIQYVGLALIFVAGGYTQFATFERNDWKAYLVAAALLIGMLLVISDYFLGRRKGQDD